MTSHLQNSTWSISTVFDSVTSHLPSSLSQSHASNTVYRLCLISVCHWKDHISGQTELCCPASACAAMSPGARPHTIHYMSWIWKACSRNWDLGFKSQCSVSTVQDYKILVWWCWNSYHNLLLIPLSNHNNQADYVLALGICTACTHTKKGELVFV